MRAGTPRGCIALITVEMAEMAGLVESLRGMDLNSEGWVRNSGLKLGSEF